MTLAEHSQALRRGTRLSQYEISTVLGSGGFGITYLARDTALDAPVAIKEYLPAELAARGSDSRVSAVSRAAIDDFDWGLRRFLEEARVLAKFRHPNIVHVFQVFEAHATAYIVMEYAEGESLSSFIQRRTRLTEHETRAILLPLMDGLKRVHQHGFLHRDIKPGNIILRQEGGPALIDFGSARQAIETKSRSITSIVTEGYAPLEQYDPNGNQGPWTDIYALGAVAYKCMTGKTPPPSTARIRNDPMVPLGQACASSLSREFEAGVGWAMSVYEEDRPQTIRALAETLDLDRPAPSDPPAGALADGEKTQRLRSPQQSSPVGTPNASAASAMLSSRRAPRRALAIAGVAITLLLLGLFAASPHKFRQPAPRPPAKRPAAQPLSRPAPAPLVSGPVQVIDTATLLVGTSRVRLSGVRGLGGDYASAFAKTLKELGGTASCAVTPDAQDYSCSVPFPGRPDGRADLSEVVLLNGAAYASATATPEQQEKEAAAKAAGRGVWHDAIRN